MNFEGRRVLVTGGGSGIGRALAIELQNKKARVAICGRHQEKLDAVAGQYPGMVGIQADITRGEEIETLHDTLEKRFGGIDILINNAGRMVQFDVQKGIPDSADAEVRLNFLAPMYLIRRFLPGLMSRSDAAIINVSSGYALWPSKSAPVYCATKAALHAFTKSLRWQLEGTSVNVIELIPPLVATESAVIKGGMSPDNFARLVVHKMQLGEQEILVSEVRLLELGRRVWPGLVDRVMKKR